jgi:diacylglycerol kinase/cell division protein FtsB
MASKKVSKASRRRLVTFGTLSFIIIGYFIFSLITYSINIGKLSSEQKQLEEKLASLQANEKNLKVEIQKLKDPDYVARYARENYLYSKDGEYIIKIQPEEKVNKKEDSKFNIVDYGFYAGIVVVVIAGFYFDLSAYEWLFCIMAIGMVSATEMINTSLEAVVDLETTKFHPLAKIAKDTASSATLLFSLTALIGALIIFVPKIMELL